MVICHLREFLLHNKSKWAVLHFWTKLQLCHTCPSSSEDPMSGFPSPLTAFSGQGHHIHQRKGAQMIAASPTALIRTVKTPVTHNEDTDTHTYLAQKSQTCVDLAKLHFVSEDRNICTLTVLERKRKRHYLSYEILKHLMNTEWQSPPRVKGTTEVKNIWKSKNSGVNRSYPKLFQFLLNTWYNWKKHNTMLISTNAKCSR